MARCESWVDMYTREAGGVCVTTLDTGRQIIVREMAELKVRLHSSLMIKIYDGDR